ncbi:NAD-dependent epimerase/dehydratase family protein [Halobium salinum]|uniref:NAD-dependent epimerase/dehydratase family protein n=1 Tax=Halobium salinum TaxID=1364940 RepID=A0ABD5PA10_9EURY|nr:NAD-dependent epimerase/dehydratase family protein [Halobium salinum]
MKCFVTGGTGFIGVNLLETLAADPSYEPVVLVRQSSNTDHLPQSIETVTGDLSSPDFLDEVMADVDVVVHLAAIYGGYTGTLRDQLGVDWERIKHINVDGTSALVDAADRHGVDRFVFFSTILAHPEFGRNLHEDYQRSKLKAERLFTETNHEFEYSILYPTFVIGPRDYRLNRFSHFQRVATNVVFAPPLYAPGAYNVVHVQDVVDSVVYCLDPEVNLDDRYVLSGENVSTGKLYRHIGQLTDNRGLVVPMPFAVSKHVLPPVVNFLHEKDLFPAPGDQFQTPTDGGTVPKRQTFRAPVEQRSTLETLADAIEWYESVGLL